MTTSIRGHKLATLREVCGLTQEELGDLVGRSVHTIRAIEQGNLVLGERLAGRISQATSVDTWWLLEDGITGLPSTPSGTLTRELYEAYAGSLLRREKMRGEFKQIPKALSEALRIILERIEKCYGSSFDTTIYRVSRFLLDLEKELPLEQRTFQEMGNLFSRATEPHAVFGMVVRPPDKTSPRPKKSSGSKKKRP